MTARATIDILQTRCTSRSYGRGRLAGVSFVVLFVCTGNICRSPIAERLLAARLPDPSIRAASAGTRAMVGYGIDQTAAHVLRRLGGEPDGHGARPPPAGPGRFR